MEKEVRQIKPTTANVHVIISKYSYRPSIESMYAYRLQDTYKCFPEGKPVRMQIAKSMRCENNRGALVLFNQRKPVYNQRKTNVYTPPLTFNRTANTDLQIRCKTSPFIMHTKAKMEKNGLDINNLYSLKRSARAANAWKYFHKKGSDFMTSKSQDFDDFLRRATTSNDVPREMLIGGSMRVVSKDNMFTMLQRGGEGDASIYGHMQKCKTI